MNTCVCVCVCIHMHVHMCLYLCDGFLQLWLTADVQLTVGSPLPEPDLKNWMGSKMSVNVC